MSTVFYDATTGQFYGRNNGLASSYFHWDDVNGRMGLGTPTPAQTLDVIGNVSISSQLFIGGLVTLDINQLTFVFDGPVKVENNSTNGSAGILFNGGAGSSNFVTFLSTIGVGTTDFIDFRTGNNGVNRAMIINSLGHVSFGGVSNAFPGFKQSGGELILRLADDSADAVLQALRISTNNAATFHTSRIALANGAGVAAGTLGTAPVAGNPTKWIGIDDNGTVRYIPAW